MSTKRVLTVGTELEASQRREATAPWDGIAICVAAAVSAAICAVTLCEIIWLPACCSAASAAAAPHAV